VPTRWFDGHLDLAYLAQQGRDLTKSVDSCGGGLQPAAVTFPELRAGNVGAALATIFVQRGVNEEEAKRRGVEALTGPWTFETPEQAFAASVAQIGIYQQWNRSGWVELLSDSNRWGGHDRLKIVLLMEGAAGVREVKEFQRFYDAGVRIVGLSWCDGTMWAGGDNSGGDVTPKGLELIAELDRLGCVHDVSHLSEAAFWTLMGTAKGLKIATHSNCRALLPGKQFPERNLSDEQIRVIAENGGIIGINLLSLFLVSGPQAPERATLNDVLRHLRHMEDVVGRRDFLALGSDFDGGYPRTMWAQDLDGPTHLHRLAEALSAWGWTDAEIERFAWGNWCGVLRKMGIEMEAD
jgi:membrane dipeptidase